MKPALLLLVLVLAAPIGCNSDVISGATIEETSSSGVTLTGIYRRQSSDVRLPTLLLLHDSGPGEDRHAFEEVWDLLDSQGYNLLAVDLRSHGESDVSGSPDALDSDPTGYPDDVLTWLDFLADRAEVGDPVDAERIGIVGLGVGASLALAAIQTGRVQCAVAISPDAAALDALRPGFLAAGDDDDSAGSDDDFGPILETAFIDGAQATSAASTEALYESAQDDKSLLLVPAPNAGRLLLDEDFEDVKITTTSWCWLQLAG